MCISLRSHHWVSKLLIAWSAPGYYRNQYCRIVHWTNRNKLLWNPNQHTIICIQGSAFEDIICKMVGIFIRLNVFQKQNMWKMHQMSVGPYSLAINSGILGVYDAELPGTRALHALLQRALWVNMHDLLCGSGSDGRMLDGLFHNVWAD